VVNRIAQLTLREHHERVRRITRADAWLATGAIALGVAAVIAASGRVDAGLLLVTWFPVVVIYLTALLAVRRSPAHPAVLRLRDAAVLFALAGALSLSIDAMAGSSRAGAVAWTICSFAVLAGDLAYAAWFDLFARFPDGRYAGRWSRWLARGAYALALLVAGTTVMQPQITVPLSVLEPQAVVTSPLPTGLTSAFDQLPELDSSLALMVPVAVVVLLARYPRADRVQRLQLRWPIAAMALLAVVIITSQAGLIFFLPDSGPVAQLIWGLCVSAVPVSLALGMLRYRLFDLDLVLRRSLVYGLLWAAIAVAYVTVAASLGLAAGSKLPLSLAVLVAIVVAMAFQPARDRLEWVADRWVFGERIEGYALIRRLGAALEATVPAAELAPTLAAAVQQGLRARWARVSIRAAADDTDVVSTVGDTGPATPALSVELSYDGERIGRIDCGPRVEGEFTPEDEDLLRTLARQASLALANARLTAALQERIDVVAAQARELAASRTRLVEAEAAERRRLERDIHDGVQQQLVSLMARLSVARAQLPSDPAAAERTLTAMQGEFRHAVADLRDLASGIHPPVLTDRGLVAAVEALAARLPIGVGVDSDGLGARRVDPQLEAAAYFGVAEALTNALKHGAAQNVAVRVGLQEGWLAVSVDDDGVGFDPAQVRERGRERGLGGLRDRVEALGGRLVVGAGTPHGTCVQIRLPVGERSDG
jgi:signal transduction histidine kinase